MSHPSRRDLERFHVEDLRGPVQDDVARHVKGCASCRDYVKELQGAKQARLASVPPGVFVERLEARRKRSWRLWAGAGSLVAAAAAAWLLLPRGVSEEPPEIRLKGGGLTVHRLRGEDVKILEESDRIRAGDGLRLVVTVSEPTPLSVWFLDEQGQVDTLWDEPLLANPGENALTEAVFVESPCQDLLVVVTTGRYTTSDLEQGVPEEALVRRLECE